MRCPLNIALSADQSLLKTLIDPFKYVTWLHFLEKATELAKTAEDDRLKFNSRKIFWNFMEFLTIY